MKVRLANERSGELSPPRLGLFNTHESVILIAGCRRGSPQRGRRASARKWRAFCQESFRGKGRGGVTRETEPDYFIASRGPKLAEAKITRPSAIVALLMHRDRLRRSEALSVVS